MFGWFRKKKSFKTINCVAYIDQSGYIIIKCFYQMFDAMEYYSTLLDSMGDTIEIHLYKSTLS